MVSAKGIILNPVQLRLSLLKEGIREADVEYAIIALPSEHRDVAMIHFKHGSEFSRDSPLISMLGQILGLTEQQIDNLFIQGAD